MTPAELESKRLQVSCIQGCRGQAFLIIIILELELPSELAHCPCALKQTQSSPIQINLHCTAGKSVRLCACSTPKPVRLEGKCGDSFNLASLGSGGVPLEEMALKFRFKWVLLLSRGRRERTWRSAPPLRNPLHLLQPLGLV